MSINNYCDFLTNNETIIQNYLLVVIGYTWFFWGTIALCNRKVFNFNPPNFFLHLGGWGPLIIAVTFHSCETSNLFTSLKNILSITYNTNISFRIILISIFLPMILVFTAAFLAKFINIGKKIQYDPSHTFVKGLQIYIAVFLICMFLIAFEEGGWRGYLLPKLNSYFYYRGSFFGDYKIDSGFVLGIFWGIWHFPIFFWNEYPIAFNDRFGKVIPYFISYCLTLGSISVFINWLYIISGSAMVGLFVHSSLNASVASLGVTRTNNLFVFIFLVSLPLIFNLRSLTSFLRINLYNFQ